MPQATTGREVEDERVSVVVMSRNRREELLRSLSRHRAPVVYVDNASTDGSADAVSVSFPDVEVVRLARNAGAYGRTIGVRRARTPFVAFADDDSWWAPGALATAAEHFAAHPRLGLIGGRVLVGPEERLDPTCAEMAGSPLPGAPGIPGAPLLGFIACGAVVRVEAFLAAGGFDDVVRFPGEEERLALDLAEHGWHLSYLDDVVAHHHPSPVRGTDDARRRALARSAVLTGAMRLPARDALTRARRMVAQSPVQRAGVRDALPDLPAALRRRRPVSDRVVAQTEMLRRAPVLDSPGHREGGQR
ncbi:Glycosyltransferase, GT2 family [Georgenia satyanarayanai]|uniref:Glycosyltransferase, GT2 family n=1 Tax=Georgenia satyanarayanai TaxID=860221 RepID=A0A2Y9ASN1_9MICO|nr:glycosyltransferase [Georgenia satyanarayanai]PYF96249.1 GT2 family glycosyltransferase [Georgenia satyanarayanai]SSA47085.1 Glycosyltransferase, GT2 family [Georgenia satyanarayanai]